MRETIFIGIDAGASGGMAVFYPDGKKVAYSFKKELTYNNILRELAEFARIEECSMFAVLEALSGYQGAGRFQMMSSQAMKMGRSYGKIEGWLEAYEIPFKAVVPRVWQKGLPDVANTHEHSQLKRVLNLLAKQRFPELKPTLQTCDAILIADYARSIYKG